MGYIAQNSPSYTCQRNGIFYLYFRLNDGLFFKSSLGTDSQRYAKKLVVYLSPYITLLRQGQLEKEQLKKIVKKTKKITKQQLEYYTIHQVIDAHQQIKDIPKDNIARPGVKRVPIETQREEARLGKEMMKDFAERGDCFSYVWLQGAKHFDGEYDGSITDDDLLDYGAKIDMSARQLFEAKDAYFNQDIIKYEQIVNTFRTPELPIIADTVIEKSSAPTLEQAWNDFVAARPHWTEQVKKENQQYYKVLALIWGEGTPVDQITKSDIKKLLQTLSGFPKKNLSPYNNMALEDILQLVAQDEIDSEDLISSKTVKSYLKLCQGFFSTYLTKEREIFENSPTTNVTYKVKENRYADYSRTEMKKMMGYFVKQTGWHKWLYLLLAYTGARLSEMVDLTIDRIKIDEDHEMHYLLIKEGKTEASQRQIPLHSYLIEQGFLAYRDEMQSLGHTRIFPELTRKDNKVRNYLTGVIEQFNIPRFNDFDQKRVLHSFRHTFITAALSNNNNEVTVQQLVGHEASQLGITKRYTHGFPLNVLQAVVEGIKWHE